MARYQVKQKRSAGILKPPGLGEVDLHSVARILHVLYGSPHHGNKADPLDELIYIHLSRRTRSTAYQKAFDRLKALFPRWSDVLEAPPAKLKRIIRPCGMANIRTRSIRQILRKIKGYVRACQPRQNPRMAESQDRQVSNQPSRSRS